MAGIVNEVVGVITAKLDAFSHVFQIVSHENRYEKEQLLGIPTIFRDRFQKKRPPVPTSI